MNLNEPISRRAALRAAAATVALGATSAAADPPQFRLATFAADVTVPMGHPLMGGGIAPASKVDDPLEARGVVLMGAGRPIVLVAVDWCEIRNDAYDRWRTVLAEAAETTPERVIVASVHQHDAPVMDLRAQTLLDAAKTHVRISDPDFHERAVQNAAKALRESISTARRVTHVGTGQAKVEGVASNRRYLDDAGKPHFDRLSATRDPAIRARPEGTIDPFLKTLSFWDGDTPLAALSVYAVHPMTKYGQGAVSADFPGLARRNRQKAVPGAFPIYFSGCSGNLVAGKYNDGAIENRPILASRLERAMDEAWKATKRTPLADVTVRRAALRLAPRDGDGFSRDDLMRKLTTDPRPFGRCLAAMGLSRRERAEQGPPIDVPAVELGDATVLLLPGESYVEYQLDAQKMRPDRFVFTIGYGECGTGYVPIERAFRENDSNLGDWCWVAPGCESAMHRAMAEALGSRTP